MKEGAETVPPPLDFIQALHAQRHKIAAVDLQLQFDLRIAIGHQANAVVSGLDIGGRGAGRQRFAVIGVLYDCLLYTSRCV